MLENGRQFSYSTETFMWAGLVAGLTNSVPGNTFSYLFYPALKIPQAGTAVQEIYVVTRSLLFANCFGGTITNLIDEIISATVSLFVYRIVQRIKRWITMGGEIPPELTERTRECKISRVFQYPGGRLWLQQGCCG